MSYKLTKDRFPLSEVLAYVFIAMPAAICIFILQPPTKYRIVVKRIINIILILIIASILLSSCNTGRRAANDYKGGKGFEDGCGNYIPVPMNKRKSLSH